MNFKKKSCIFVLLIYLGSFSVDIYALNTGYTGYKTSWYSRKIKIHGKCAFVSHLGSSGFWGGFGWGGGTTSNPYFIPTRTAREWNSVTSRDRLILKGCYYINRHIDWDNDYGLFKVSAAATAKAVCNPGDIAIKGRSTVSAETRPSMSWDAWKAEKERSMKFYLDNDFHPWVSPSTSTYHSRSYTRSSFLEHDFVGVIADVKCEIK